jgi:hypothetical protein
VNPVVAKNIKQIADGPTAAGADSGSLGAMREDADLLDATVEEAMRRRRLQAWRPTPADFAALESIAEETGQTLNELLDEALRLLLERRGRRQTEKGLGRGDV